MVEEKVVESNEGLTQKVGTSVKDKEYHTLYMRERRAKKKREGLGALEEFVEHVRDVALDKDAPAAVMGIYKELLKYKEQMGKEKVISGDELARQNIEAERQLKEEGYVRP